MKNLFLLSLTFLLILFIPPLNAQPQIGPKAGLNIANVAGDDADILGESLDSRTGFTGGIFFMYQFSNLFAIQPEAYYTMKGATRNINGFEFTFAVDYIEVPFLLKLIIPVEGSNVRPSIFAGPSVGFNTTAKVKLEADGESGEDDIKEDVTSTDFGLVFGGGIGFMVGTNELGFDIRYILGLSTLDDTSDNLDIKNTVIAFNVYFGFSLL
jgi:hypothetical protein